MKKFKFDNKAITFGVPIESNQEIIFTPSFDRDFYETIEFNERVPSESEVEETYRNKYQSNRYTEGIYEFVSKIENVVTLILYLILLINFIFINNLKFNI